MLREQKVTLAIDALPPTTLPMVRLADYLKAFAAILGNEEHVHFQAVTSGSACCEAIVEAHAVPKVTERVQQVVAQNAPKAAMKAYQEIDDYLMKDNAVGVVLLGGHKVIEFPGRRRTPQEVIGPVKRRTSIEGQVFSISGRDDTINVSLRDAVGGGGQELRCVVSVPLARKLGPYLLGPRIRFFGEGVWFREDGLWRMRNFHASDFAELKEVPLDTALESMRVHLAGIDPDEFMASMAELRHG